MNNVHRIGANPSADLWKVGSVRRRAQLPFPIITVFYAMALIMSGPLFILTGAVVILHDQGAPLPSANSPAFLPLGLLASMIIVLAGLMMGWFMRHFLDKSFRDVTHLEIDEQVEFRTRAREQIVSRLSALNSGDVQGNE